MKNLTITPSKQGETIKKAIGGLLGSIMAKSYDKSYALHGSTSRLKDRKCK